MLAMASPPSGPSLPSPGAAGDGPSGTVLSTRMIAGIAGLVTLVVIVCCIGAVLVARGDDDAKPGVSPSTKDSGTSEPVDTTDTPTTQTSTPSPAPTPTPTTDTPSATPSSTTSEPSEPSGSSDSTSSSTTSEPTADFPQTFDGWTRSESATATRAIYRKGEHTLSVMAIRADQVDAYYERLWEEPSKHGEVTCGKLSTSTNFQCVGEVDGVGVLVSSSAETPDEAARILTDLLEAISAA